MTVSSLSKMFANGTILTGDCATCGDNKGATVVTRVAMQNLEKMSKPAQRAVQAAPVDQPKPKESPLAAAKERIEKNV